VAGSHRRTLAAIFRHPLAHYLEWREVVGLISHIGHIQERSGDEFLFTVGAEHQFMRKPHTKDLTGPDVMALRHLLVRAGWSADGAPEGTAELSVTAAPDLIAVIDHNEAQVWRVALTAGVDGSDSTIEAYDPRHFLHHMVQKTHRLDHGKTSADDRVFLEDIAKAMSVGGRIVVIGHGVGESNMAAQTTAWLKTHHPQIWARIVEEIVADLPGLTTAQRLDLGRHALEDHQTRSS
jgi:hypothetical protein